MKKLIYTFVTIVLLCTMMSCWRAATEKQEQLELRVISSEFFMTDALFEQFTEETGIVVTSRTTSTTLDNVDVLFLIDDTYIVSRPEIFVELAHDILPNIANVDEVVLNAAYDNDMLLSVPLIQYGLSFIVNTQLISTPVNSWRAFREVIPGRVVLPVDPQLVFAGLLLDLRRPINSRTTADLTDAQRQFLTLWSIRNDIEFALADEYLSGDVGIVYGDFTSIRLQLNDEQLANTAVVFPAEGTVSLVKSIAITQDAQIGISHQFINFVLREDVMQQFLADNNITPITVPSIRWEELESTDELYREWTRIQEALKARASL